MSLALPERIVQSFPGTPGSPHLGCTVIPTPSLLQHVLSACDPRLLLKSGAYLVFTVSGQAVLLWGPHPRLTPLPFLCTAPVLPPTVLTLQQHHLFLFWSPLVPRVDIVAGHHGSLPEGLVKEIMGFLEGIQGGPRKWRWGEPMRT